MSVATALEEQAAPGTILCSDATARLIRGTVRLKPWGPLQVPGSQHLSRPTRSSTEVSGAHLWSSTVVGCSAHLWDGSAR